MMLVRCLICGETYLGTEVPSRCPFCGAHPDLMVESSEYPMDINEMVPTDVEVADIHHAIALETRNARYYLGMSARDKNSQLSSAYKRLGKIENEHCDVFCKLLRIPMPADITSPLDTGADWCEDIKFSLHAEMEASAFYAEAAARATTPRVKQVFEAVSAVERDHIALDGLTAKIAGCE